MVDVLDSDDEAASAGSTVGRGGGDDAAVAALVGTTKEAGNVFVELRKAANHPLLLREHYKDEAKMSLLTKRLYSYGHFGDQCSQEVATDATIIIAPPPQPPPPPSSSSSS